MNNGENQTQDLAELERMTNEAEGWELQTNTPEQTPEAVEPQTETPPVSAESQPVAPEVQPVAQENKSVGISDEVLKVLEETPFKSVPDVVKAYKNSQSEYTKLHERVKPYEQLIDDVQRDSGLRQFVEQAIQLYRNPSLAQQYAQPQQEAGNVNPANYDLYTPEGQVAYQKAVEDRAQKVAFETVNQRMSGWEQQQALEKAKLEFTRKFPDGNPDEVLKFVQERQGKWTLEDAFKIANYDKLNEQAFERARKEISSKMNEAAKNTPVSSAPTDKPAVSPTEVMQYITKYGNASANKKWGADKVTSAIKQFTEDNS